jgi:hypothetical protein
VLFFNSYSFKVNYNRFIGSNSVSIGYVGNAAVEGYYLHVLV